MRVAIAGGPECGKSTLADAISARHPDVPRFSTDDYQHRAWGDVPHAVLNDLVKQDSYILEGVQVPRILRRAINNGSPFRTPETVFWLPEPFRSRSLGAEDLAKGVETVFDDVRPGLVARGIKVQTLRRADVAAFTRG